MTWKNAIKKEEPKFPDFVGRDSYGNQTDISPMDDRELHDLKNMVDTITGFLNSSPRLSESRHLKTMEDNLQKVLKAIYMFNANERQ